MRAGCYKGRFRDRRTLDPGNLLFCPPSAGRRNARWRLWFTNCQPQSPECHPGACPRDPTLNESGHWRLMREGCHKGRFRDRRTLDPGNLLTCPPVAGRRDDSWRLWFTNCQPHSPECHPGACPRDPTLSELGHWRLMRAGCHKGRFGDRRTLDPGNLLTCPPVAGRHGMTVGDCGSRTANRIPPKCHPGACPRDPTLNKLGHWRLMRAGCHKGRFRDRRTLDPGNKCRDDSLVCAKLRPCLLTAFPAKNARIVKFAASYFSVSDYAEGEKFGY
jgi:hypothetical protein